MTDHLASMCAPCAPHVQLTLASQERSKLRAQLRDLAKAALASEREGAVLRQQAAEAAAAAAAAQALVAQQAQLIQRQVPIGLGALQQQFGGYWGPGGMGQSVAGDGFDASGSVVAGEGGAGGVGGRGGGGDMGERRLSLASFATHTEQQTEHGEQQTEAGADLTEAGEQDLDSMSDIAAGLFDDVAHKNLTASPTPSHGGSPRVHVHGAASPMTTRSSAAATPEAPIMGRSSVSSDAARGRTASGAADANVPSTTPQPAVLVASPPSLSAAAAAASGASGGNVVGDIRAHNPPVLPQQAAATTVGGQLPPMQSAPAATTPVPALLATPTAASAPAGPPSSSTVLSDIAVAAVAAGPAHEDLPPSARPHPLPSPPRSGTPAEQTPFAGFAPDGLVQLLPPVVPEGSIPPPSPRSPPATQPTSPPAPVTLAVAEGSEGTTATAATSATAEAGPVRRHVTQMLQPNSAWEGGQAVQHVVLPSRTSQQQGSEGGTAAPQLPPRRSTSQLSQLVQGPQPIPIRPSLGSLGSGPGYMAGHTAVTGGLGSVPPSPSGSIPARASGGYGGGGSSFMTVGSWGAGRQWVHPNSRGQVPIPVPTQPSYAPSFHVGSTGMVGSTGDMGAAGMPVPASPVTRQLSLPPQHPVHVAGACVCVRLCSMSCRVHTWCSVRCVCMHAAVLHNMHGGPCGPHGKWPQRRLHSCRHQGRGAVLRPPSSSLFDPHSFPARSCSMTLIHGNMHTWQSHVLHAALNTFNQLPGPCEPAPYNPLITHPLLTHRSRRQWHGPHPAPLHSHRWPCSRGLRHDPQQPADQHLWRRHPAAPAQHGPGQCAINTRQARGPRHHRHAPSLPWCYDDSAADWGCNLCYCHPTPALPPVALSLPSHTWVYRMPT